MAVAVLLLLLGSVAGAAAQPPAAGSADVIQGRVLNESGAFLRGARVVVLTSSGPSQPVYADHGGRFQIAVGDRRAARLRISKAGYAPRELTLGTDGAFDVRLTPGAALTGQVLDHAGHPAAGVFVVIRPAACTPPCRAPERAAAPAATAARAGRQTAVDAVLAPLVAETDDRGEFRFGSLPAGRYEVGLGGRSPVSWSADPAVAIDPAAALTTPLATVTLSPGQEAAVRLTVTGDSGGAFGAQPPPAAAGDSETGLVRGIVRGWDGRAIAGATILIERAGGETVQVARADARGRYILADLPPGRFRLTVFAAGLPAAELGQQRALQPGRSLLLRAGEVLDHVDIDIPRSHVISGRVVDVYDEPIEHLIVQAWQQRFVDGQLVLEPATARVQRTDDRGRYRIHGLLPGTYFIVAYDAPGDISPHPVTVAPAVSRAAAMAMAGRGSGRGGPGMTARGIVPDLARAPMVPPLYVSPQAPLTYYPGRPFLSDAVPVRIRHGMDRAGVDFVFTPAHGTRIDGRVVDSRGQPVQADVLLLARGQAGTPIPPRRVAQSGADGLFAFAHVPPGDYVLQASTGRMAACRAVPFQAAGCGGGVTRSTWEFGTTHVRAAGGDSVSVTVWTTRGASISGRVVLEGGERWSLSPSEFTLVAVPAGGDGAPAGIQPRAVVGAGGRFTMADLSGTVRFMAVDVPPGWYLTSVRIGGVDALEHPVTFGPAGSTRTDVDVTFSTRGGEVHGLVLDAGRRPVPSAAVIAYPADVARWHDWSRAMIATVSGPDGHFLLTTLPPGEYFVAAVAPTADAIDDDWRNPEVLYRLTPGARRITLRPGERAATELRPLR